MYSLNDYLYSLPESLIAQVPLDPPESARLLVDGEHSTFADLPSYLHKGDLIAFNDTRVLRARLLFEGGLASYGWKEHIFDGEILFLEWRDASVFEARIFPGRRFPVGARITLKAFDLELEVAENTETWRAIRVLSGDMMWVLEKYWVLPLPPYVESSQEWQNGYQTAFAKKDGSVAAPTASLHFSQNLLGNLERIGIEKAFITLHVGLGTFRSIDCDDIRDFKIHSEACEIDRELFEIIAEKKQNNSAIIAVGTTVCRTLESLPSLWLQLPPEVHLACSESAQRYWNGIATTQNRPIDSCQVLGQSIRFRTRCYLVPWAEFLIVDRLITNFHLPKTSLLVLVSAFAGYGLIREMYELAIREQYRFYSFGDGMLLTKAWLPHQKARIHLCQ